MGEQERCNCGANVEGGWHRKGCVYATPSPDPSSDQPERFLTTSHARCPECGCENVGPYVIEDDDPDYEELRGQWHCPDCQDAFDAPEPILAVRASALERAERPFTEADLRLIEKAITATWVVEPDSEDHPNAATQTWRKVRSALAPEDGKR